MVGGVRFFHYDQAKSTGGRISFSIYVHVSRVSNWASISQEIHVCLPHYFGNCRAHRSPNFRSVAYMVYFYSDFCRHPRQDMFSRLYAWVSKLVSSLKRDHPGMPFIMKVNWPLCVRLTLSLAVCNVWRKKTRPLLYLSLHVAIQTKSWQSVLFPNG